MENFFDDLANAWDDFIAGITPLKAVALAATPIVVYAFIVIGFCL